MATITKGKTFGATEEVTAAKLHALVDDASITGIVSGEIEDSAVTNTKIETVSGAKFTNLSSTPVAAGRLPTANMSENIIAAGSLVIPLAEPSTLSNGMIWLA